MDINKIREKLEKLNAKAEPSKKVDNSSKKWRPSVGKQTIRIVPFKFDKDNPFTELKVHYNIGKRTMISPTNWGEKDPVIDLIKELKNAKGSDNWKLARKLEPKTRVFVPDIERRE